MTPRKGRPSSGRYMLTFSRRPHVGSDPSYSANVPAENAHPPRLRWMNFSFCPHCVANGRPCMLERLNEWGPMISRSDGKSFHLVLGDRPIEYPHEKNAGRSDMKSVGFWYVHEANGNSTETVVVILRRPPRGGVFLLRHLELVADQLYETLGQTSRRPRGYEMDWEGHHSLCHGAQRP